MRKMALITWIRTRMEMEKGQKYQQEAESGQVRLASYQAKSSHA
jgi:hypothetical protein